MYQERLLVCRQAGNSHVVAITGLTSGEQVFLAKPVCR